MNRIPSQTCALLVLTIVLTGLGAGATAQSPDGLNWMKEEGIRVDRGGAFAATGVASPEVVGLPGGAYRMYYTGWDTTYARYRILSALSSDGIYWTQEDGIRIDNGTFDARYAYDPDVIRLSDGSFRMYYTGLDYSGIYRILSAVSTDGVVWTKENGNRITDLSSTSGDTVLLSDGTYRMYYSARDPSGTGSVIFSALSADGLTWAEEEGVRVVRGDYPSYDAGYAAHPDIVELPDGSYRMYYTGWAGAPTYKYHILSAISENGLDWMKEPGETIPAGGAYDADYVSSKDVVALPNGNYRMYYTGHDGQHWRILSAVSGEVDSDGDGVSDAEDLCPGTAAGASVDAAGCSDAQVDGDGDGVCDPGAASDGPLRCTGSDNCPDDANAGQEDLDDDGVGDLCDDDADGDGDPAGSDCDDLDPTRYAGATEICTDGVDNNCDGQIDEQLAGADCDADGVPNELDNCPLDYNEFQEDLDGDDLGDVCDDDIDGDTVANDDDNCPVNANTDQEDLDGDGAGDACDADADGDGLDDATADLCLGTTTDPIAGVPSKSLGKNRWAEMDGNAQFDTNGNKPTGRMFSVYTTGGCSCAQIIEICEYGQGHTKFGCSNSVMDWWTGLYDREGEAPFQCKED